jgi:plasmid stabilization system protein ParE
VSQVRWTAEAVEDLASIKAYIERDSPSYAQLIIERPIERAEQIAEFPLAGRVVPELGRDDVHEVIFRNYRIAYWLYGDMPLLITIFHATRLFPIPKDAIP